MLLWTLECMYLFELVGFFFFFFFPFRWIPKGGIGTSIFNFGKPPHCFLLPSTLFPTVSASVYILTSSVLAFHFHHIFPALVICVLFDVSRSDRCVVISYCGFDSHFPDDSDIGHLFICLLAICVSFLGECQISRYHYKLPS